MMEGKCANQIYDGHKFFLLPARLGNTRLSILKGNIIKQGGILLTSLEDSDNVLTHVVVEESFLSNPDKCYKIFKDMNVNCSHLEIVTTKWLSSCFKEQKLLETKPFLLGLCNTSTHLIQPSGKQDNAAIIQSAPIYQEPGDLTLSHASSPKKRKHDDEVVETVQIPDTSVVFNSVIISELNKLAETFRSIGDQWRAHGYEKAVAAVKGYGKNINTYEEAVALPGIGKKMAEKIMEIIETGSLRKVDEVCNSEKSRIMKLFTKIWGVGPATAQSWYVQGFRTLEDLESKANLTKQQRIGLKYFEEFQEKIPREEVQQVGDIVIENALVINNNVTPVLCGSYRRGKSSCGDIDVLLLTEGSLSELLAALLKRLKVCGLITDDLTNTEDSGGHKKFLGVCQLPGGKYRRLDIFVAPKSEMATALMHYTGSALFNRSIRLLAMEKGMYLTEHYLMSGVVREGPKVIKEGIVLQTPTEESIFQHLGLKYKSPEERNQ